MSKWLQHNCGAVNRIAAAVLVVQILILGLRLLWIEPSPVRDSDAGAAAVDLPRVVRRMPAGRGPMAPGAAASSRKGKVAARGLPRGPTPVLRGEVRDERGDPLRAVVTLAAVGGGEALSPRWDLQHRAFAFDHLPEGVLELVVRAEGFRTERLSSEELSFERPMVIRLLRGEELHCVVRSADGAGIAGVWIEVRGAGGYLEQRRSDREGGFDLPSPGGGTLRFTLVKRGYEIVNSPRLPIRAGASSLDPFVLRPARVFQGRVVDSLSREPIAGAQIQIAPASMLAAGDIQRRAYPEPVSTDDDGVFRFAGVPAGAAMMVIRARGYAEVMRPQRISGLLEQMDEFVLVRGVPLRGRVSHDGRVPVEGADVEVQQQSLTGTWVSLGLRQRTTGDGRFDFESIPTQDPVRVLVYMNGREMARSDRLVTEDGQFPEVRIRLE